MSTGTGSREKLRCFDVGASVEEDEGVRARGWDAVTPESQRVKMCHVSYVLLAACVRRRTVRQVPLVALARAGLGRGGTKCDKAGV